MSVWNVNDALLWREQFDHARNDFLASLRHDNRDDVLKALKCEIWTKLQKWWELFGRYWLIVNRHNDDNVKLMGWLMNGAHHGTVDVCGENVSIMKPVQDRRRGIRLLTGDTIDNHSKLLKLELGQQIPIKSPHKMKRDLIKRATASNPMLAYELIPDRCFVGTIKGLYKFRH